MTNHELNEQWAASLAQELTQMSPSRLRDILTQSKVRALDPALLCEVVNVRSLTNIVNRLPEDRED